MAMRKAKDVIGKDILSYADGVKVSSVKDFVIGNDNRGIVALLVDEGGLMRSARVIPFNKVTSVGKDAVMVTESMAVTPADLYEPAIQAMQRNEKLLGKKVFTEDGADQGTISDLFFDDTSGAIMGYEVSGGLIKDIQKGESFLAPNEIVNIGTDVVLIRPEAVHSLEEQVGGVQGALQNAGQQIGQKVDDAKNKIGQTVGQRAEDAVVGRRAGSTVSADDGSIIVFTGQRIGPDNVQRARATGKMDALLAAAGAGGAQEAGQNAGNVLGQAGQQVGVTAERAADKAGTLWDQFKRKLNEMAGATGERVDEETTKRKLASIEDAIGRPITKVLLDQQDNVILNLGDVITHTAVQKAHEANMLDSLLDNVYKGEVEFSKDEMRVNAEAQATVEKATGEAPVVDEMRDKVTQAQEKHDQERQQREMQAEQGRQEREQGRDQREQERQQREQTMQQGQGQQDQPAQQMQGSSTNSQTQDQSQITKPQPRQGSMSEPLQGETGRTREVITADSFRGKSSGGMQQQGRAAGGQPQGSGMGSGQNNMSQQPDSESGLYAPGFSDAEVDAGMNQAPRSYPTGEQDENSAERDRTGGSQGL